jgi:uncharacterized membrane protein
MQFPHFTKKERQKEIATLFDLGLIVKAFMGLVEMIAAFFVALTPKTFVLMVANLVTQGELSADPDDPVASGIREAARSFSIHSHTLLILYLFFHGVIKFVLVIAIFMFSSYELYIGLLRHNLLLLAISAFDAALFCITAYEYRKLQKRERTQTA